MACDELSTRKANEQYQRGTMRPQSNDPDEGARDHGGAIEMIYDEFEGKWVEQRKLASDQISTPVATLNPSPPG